MAAEKKKSTYSLSVAKMEAILQELGPFYFTSSPPSPLFSIKETGIQTLIKGTLGY